MTAGDPEEVRVAMIVVTTMVMTLIRWDRNLISLKLFLRWIDRVSPLDGLVVQLDEPPGALYIISMRLICWRGLRGLVFFVEYF